MLTFIPLSIIVWMLNVILNTTHLWSTAGWIIFTGVRLLIWIGIVILWFVLILKAYQGELFKLPIVGEIAENQIK